jgi:anti-sigma factor RsiW
MTAETKCDRVDAFLGGELSIAEAEAFNAHAESCSACRAAIDEQRWIDGLLTSAIRVESDRPNTELIEEIRASLSAARQRAGVLTWGLAAAAVLLAVGWGVLFRQPPSDAVSTNLPKIATHDRSFDLAPQSAPRAIVTGGPDTLVMPLESRWPDVTIVRVYPAYQPEFNGGTP